MRAFAATACALALMRAAAQGPVFHWPLDESSGTIAQAWGGANGILAGGVTWAPNAGRHQGCARFNGVDGRILLGPCDITTGSGAFTLSLWAKADFVTGMDRTLIAKATGPGAADQVWSIAFVSGSALRFRVRAGGQSFQLTTPPSSLFGGQWYHIAGVYDGAQLRLYVNASLMGSAPASGLVGLHPQSPASLGALSTGAQPFSGWIDDARVYDRALSESELLGILFETLTTGLADAAAGLRATDRWVEVPEGPHTLRVLDATGRTAHQRQVRGPLRAELPALPAGVHFLWVEGASGSRAARIAVP